MAMRNCANGFIVTKGRLPCTAMIRGAGPRASVCSTSWREMCSGTRARIRSSVAASTVAPAGTAPGATDSDARAPRSGYAGPAHPMAAIAASSAQAIAPMGMRLRVPCPQERKEAASPLTVCGIAHAEFGEQESLLVSRLRDHQQDVDRRHDPHGDRWNDHDRAGHEQDAQRVDRMPDVGVEPIDDELRLLLGGDRHS